MKKSVYLIIACFCIAISSQATVWTVSNDPLNPAQFNDIQVAVDTSIVQDYDTLYVQPSPYNYGNLVIRRPLVIIGSGFNPQKENKFISELGYILFKSLNDEWGNEIKSADGTILMGLKINIIGNNGSFNGEHSNGGTDYITISKCDIATIYMCADSDPVIGWNISGCIIGDLDTGKNQMGYSGDNSENISNCLLANNIIKNGVSEFKSSEIVNNLFISDRNSVFYNVTYCTIKNNCFYFSDLNIASSSNCNFYNNISYIGGLTDRNASFTGGTNNTFSDNLENVDPQFVFEEDRVFDFTDDYHLADGSPAIGAGFSGGDLGIFEGTSPYVESGAPSIPQILQMNIHDEMVPGGTNLNVTLKAVKAE